MVNRFEELRYENKLSATPFISMSQLAKELGISKATVSKLEHDENYDARISIIKKYKEQFPEVSYDYLLGATGTKHKQYSRVEEELPFSNEFYNTLVELVSVDDPISEDRFSNKIEYLLEAMLHNPEQLKKFLNSIYNALQNIYSIKNTVKNVQYSKPEDFEKETNEQYFYINRTVTNYFENFIFPLLEGIFERDYQEARRKYFEDFPFSDTVPFGDSNPLNDEELPF